MIDLTQYPYFSIDTETTGLNYPVAKAFGFAVYTPDDKSEYYDIRNSPEVIERFNSQMAHYRGDVICHNASFDYKMTHNSDMFLPLERLDDTVIRACQINEHEHSYSLDFLGSKYIGENKVSTLIDELADIFGGSRTKSAQMPNLQHAPFKIVAPYCIQDAALTLKLWEWQRSEIELQGIHEICTFERDLLPTFIRNEMRGIRVDVDQAEKAQKPLTKIINTSQKTLNEVAGVDVNVNSPTQIRKIFKPVKVSDTQWTTSTGELLGITPKGQPSVGSEFLREMVHPAAKLILEIRTTLKTRDTFLKGHVLSNAVDGRVYPTINQSKGPDGGTGTGRISYAGPAMQQIPSRKKEVASLVKPCFLPDFGQVWVDTDMASFEVRTFAHLVNDENLIRDYMLNPQLDMHQWVAGLTGLPRNASFPGEAYAKQLNLSMIMNSGPGAIAAQMGMPFTWECFLPRGRIDVPENYVHYRKPGAEAQKVIATYHARLPGVARLAKKAKAVAEQRGYVFGQSGRRLRFPHARKAYQASAKLIQSLAADINKKNIKIIEETLEDQGHLILNVHDSYGLSLPEDWKPLCNKVKHRIENSHNLRVPLILDITGAGKNWWDAIKND